MKPKFNFWVIVGYQIVMNLFIIFRWDSEYRFVLCESICRSDTDTVSTPTKPKIMAEIMKLGRFGKGGKTFLGLI